jgi:hypothetical protein
MRTMAVLAVLTFTTCFVTAEQRKPTTIESDALPHAPCRYSRLAVLWQVKEIAHLDLSASMQKPVEFPIGTTVSVSARSGDWSCVTGSVETSLGWQTRTGWMKTSLLNRAHD